MGIIVRFILSFGILEFVSVGLLLINLVTFVLYVFDKYRAKVNRWRVRESVLILFTLCGGMGAFLGMIIARHKTRRAKFKVAVVIGLIIFLVPAIHIIHGVTLGRVVRYVEVPFYSANWPAELNGYRIGFVSDMHINQHGIENIVAELNRRNLDLLLLGGDFSMRDDHYQSTLNYLAQVITTDGIFGVEGNHDDYVRVFAHMERLGITPLDNSGLYIRNDFFLAGVQDLWNRAPNINQAIAGANAADFILLLSHNPDVTMQQPTTGVDLVLAGHTHGGQITFFGIPLYLLRGSITDYGMRFGSGFAYLVDNVPVYVTSGIGVYYSVPRIFTRPEVVIFTMYGSRETRIVFAEIEEDEVAVEFLYAPQEIENPEEEIHPEPEYLSIIFTAEPLPQHIIDQITGVTFHENNRVQLTDLAYLTVTHVDFEQKNRHGNLIVAAHIADEVLDIFREIFAAGFPIHQIRLIDYYNACDETSLEANNSSAFNFRYIAGTTTLSRHALGLAIDINPVQNPYVRGGNVLPAAGVEYLDRDNVRPGMIVPGDAVYNAFISRGWTWGGNWTSLLDFHHFERR